MAGKTESSPFRRSARVNLRIPVHISGRFSDHKEFSEETFAVTLSKFGAKIRSALPLKRGMQLKLRPKGRKDFALFRVAWVGQAGTWQIYVHETVVRRCCAHADGSASDVLGAGVKFAQNI